MGNLVSPVRHSFWYELGLVEDDALGRLAKELEHENRPPGFDQRKGDEQLAPTLADFKELTHELLQLLGPVVRCVCAIGKRCCRIPLNHFNSVGLRHRRSLSLVSELARLGGFRGCLPLSGPVSHGGAS